MLDPNQSLARQKRMLDRFPEVDAIVTGLPAHVYYLSAHRPFWLHESAFILWADGRSMLIAANCAPEAAAADRVVLFEASFQGTQRQEQAALVTEKVLKHLSERGAKRVGIDVSAVGSQIAMGFDGGCNSIDPWLWQARRRKGTDELELMKTAIACTRAMYERAREIIEPGIPELRVFSELHSAAVNVAGEPLSALLGNDYACAAPGGPPRKDRTAQSGELYILDLGPAYRGYFSDNCRTIAVNGKPTDAQQEAWEIVSSVFPIIERLARPGVRCRDIVDAVNEHFVAAKGKPLSHHLGHGVGLQPHEFPHLNVNWDDTLQEGEVFTVEPGMYGPELAAGMRLENQYLVTATGVENLTPFPLEMT